MPTNPDPTLPERLKDRRSINEALLEGTRAALRRHQQAGAPIAVWQNGEAVLIDAGQIEIDAPTIPERRVAS